MADRRRASVLAIGVVALGGAALAGYLVTRGGEATAADPWLPTGSAAVSPPPSDPADVATDTAVPTEAAAVHITYSGPDEGSGGVVVGASVAGLIEEGGRCALTLTLEGAVASTETDALADASATSCGQMLVPFAELSSGTWVAEVTYASPTGSSVAPGHTTVEVP